ncbi:MAG: hypothetical protein AAGF56_04495 [Pseudomonadota bacterium]
MATDENDAALAGAKATTEDVLDLSSLTVIGVVDAPSGAATLLRSRTGQIARVTAGASAFGVKVTAIGDSQVLLTNRWGQTQAYAVAGG